MLLPNASRAEASQGKIVNYLLDTNHPRGKSKAKFFLLMGFSVAEWTVLRDALLQHCVENKVISQVIVPFKQSITNYVVGGFIDTPINRRVFVISVWKIDSEDLSGTPHLVSARPEKAPS